MRGFAKNGIKTRWRLQGHQVTVSRAERPLTVQPQCHRMVRMCAVRSLEGISIPGDCNARARDECLITAIARLAC